MSVSSKFDFNSLYTKPLNIYKQRYDKYIEWPVNDLEPYRVKMYPKYV